LSPGRGPFSGLGREGGLVVEKALDKLCPIAFVRCFSEPIFDRAIIINNDFGDFYKE
jgi:hypothetical protein